MCKQIFVLLLVLTLARPAVGQVRSIETLPPGEDRIVVLKLGDPAPFAGQLYDNNTALRWANWLKQYRLRLDLDVRTQEDICAVRMQALSESLVIERGHYDDMSHAYQAKVADLEFELNHQPWYRSPWLGVALGAVLTAGAVVGVVVLAEKK